jgi:tetratricopeptide (TPR) repeat protein
MRIREKTVGMRAGRTSRTVALIAGLLVMLFVAGPVLAQGLMSQTTFNRLERIHDMMDEDDYESALRNSNIARERAQNDHERAVIAQLIGYIHINLENYEDALDEFIKAVDIEDGLPVNPRLNTIVNITQLYAQFEDWEKSLEYVDRYISIYESADLDDEPSSRVYLIGAQANMQLDRMRDALPYIRKAIELEDEPNENYYRALLSILFELEEYRDAVETLEVMVGYWSDNMTYWFQMFSLNIELGDEQEALSVLKLAHRKGLFERETHYVNLYRMYMLEGAPHDGGRVLSDGIDEGVVPRNEARLEMLSRAWIQAQELDRAIEVLEELADIQDHGKSDMTIAQIAQERADWDLAIAAATRAYEKGGLDEPGHALLLAGRAAAESKDYDQALAIFERATNYETSRNQANQWVNYIEEERAILGQR